VGVARLFFLDQTGFGLIGHVLAASICRTLIPEVPPSLDEMVVSASQDIVPTCPCEDPTPCIVVTARVAYIALVDQHIVPS
jgi:hypothetical protein